MKTRISLQQEDIIRFLRENIEPFADAAFGTGYRASVTLTDGLYLPCVVFRNPDTIVDLAIKRFHDERSGKSIFKWSSGQGYRDIVRNFVTNGNCINYYDVVQIGISPYAFPQAILNQVESETKMGWTGFVARMKDGKLFAFGTSFYFWFFDLPEGYATDDISEIINHSYLDPAGQIRSYHAPEVYEEFDRSKVYRERTFFDCFIDSL